MPAKEPQQNSKTTQLSVLASSSLAGLFRGLVGLPFQHPFDTVKTNMQAFQTDFRQTFKKIYESQGVKGFYSGFTVNSLRVASKQIYRWPLQIALLGFFNQNFGDTISRSTSGILCGISMAAIEVAIICPFEKLKVWMMTKSNDRTGGIFQFFKTFPISRLFDGIYPVFWKQMISWVTFLGATEYLKEVAYWYSGKDRLKEDLSSGQVFGISMGVALINTLFVMPVDCIKTHYQQFRPMDNQPVNKTSLREMTAQIYHKYGIRGLFKGWESKLIQYNINSYFTVAIFESTLKKYELLGSRGKVKQ